MEANVQSTSWMDKIMGDSEFNRFGLICVVLLVVGCLGGTAVGLGAINNTFTLIMVTIPTMLTLSLLLAVSPMRYIITSALISVAIDVVMIVYFSLLA